jgi:Mrp family chromosome partitioning ATPase/capsular polysaccharide biosynthesis protein
MNETNDASAMFAPLWRRKWLILAVGVLVAVGTYFYYRHQRAGFAAATEIYLAAGSEEQVTSTGSLAPAGRKAGLEGTAQAALIDSPIIRLATREQLKKAPKTKAVRAALRGKVRAKAPEKSAFVTITAEARDKKGAALLADTTAETYVSRVNARYRRAIAGAIAIARRQIHRLNADQEAAALAGAAKGSSKGGKASSEGAAEKNKATTTSDSLQIANLSTKLNQLESNLAVKSVSQVAPATAKSLATSPKRNAIFGFVLGLLLASILAYAISRFDQRLRTLAQIERVCGLEILTALPAARRPIVTAAGSRPRPSRRLYEPLGRLQTSLQVAAVASGNGQPAKPRTILVTSAESGDGKSTVVAGLAMTERDAGNSVAVVEADLRRPSLAPLLGVEPRPGLADVLEGRLHLYEAVQVIGGINAVESPAAATATTELAVRARAGSLTVLAGAPVENASGLLASAVMSDTLRELASGHEQVLIDAPPPLEVGDAIPLLSMVDAVVVVARAGHTSEAAMRRLMQLLQRRNGAPVLGVVANGVSARDSRRYGFSTYGDRGLASRLGLR